MERVMRVKRNITRKDGKMVFKHVMVMDISTLDLSKLNSVKDLVKIIIGAVQNSYPESLYKMYLVNSGWFFKMVWGIVQMFVDPLTKKKISVLGGSWRKTLAADGIPDDQ